MKKGLALLLCLMMTLIGTGLTTVALADEEPIEIVMGFFSLNGVPSDLQMVLDAINEITIPEIGVKLVDPIIDNYGNYHEQFNLILSGNEQLDLFMCWGTYWLPFYTKGQIIELDDLLEEYGQGIIEAVGREWLDAGKAGGHQYGITTNRDLAVTRGFVLLKDICEKYDIDVASIQTLDDLGEVFQIIKDNEPGMIPVSGANGGDKLLDTICTYDSLGDTLGVLMNYGEEPVVVNYFDTDEYEQYVRYFHEWYQKGYVTEEVMTSSDNTNPQMTAGRLFANTSNIKPGFDTKQSLTVQRDVVSVPMVEVNTNSSVVQQIQWYIPVNCDHPDKAMQFLNMMYTDERIVNLLCWGIEGVHYAFTEDGHIDFPEGVTADTSGYNLNMGFAMGNQFLSHIWVGDELTMWDDLKEFNETAIFSCAFGFCWDPEPVKTEVAALNNVLNEYRCGLEWGVLDPDTALPEFREKLHAAGIDKVVEEKQRQLDEWLATKQG